MQAYLGARKLLVYVRIVVTAIFDFMTEENACTAGDFVLNSLNHNICMHTCMYVCMHGCNCKCVVSVCICVYMWTDLHFMFFSFRIIIGLGVAVLVLGGCCYSFKRGREAFSQFCDR